MADGRDILLGPGGLSGFTVHTDREPNAGTRRLMDWLGVEFDVTATASLAAICLVGGCDWAWDGEGDRAAAIEAHRDAEHDYIPAWRFSVRSSLNGVDGYDDGPDEGLPVLPAEITEPEPQREVETVAVAEKWSRESIVDAIQEWALERGAPPKAADWNQAEDGHPAKSTVTKYCGSWADAIVAAGFPRPTRGSPKGPRSSVGEPKVREASGHSSPAASSSPPLPEGDAVVPAVSPGPVPTEAEAGSRTDEYLDWLAETVDVVRLGAQLEELERQAAECQRKAGALRQIVAAVKKLEALESA